MLGAWDDPAVEAVATRHAGSSRGDATDWQRCITVGQERCPPPGRTPFVLVVVAKNHSPKHVRDWLWYHAHLGVSHFVLISNECDDAAHAALLAAAAAAPCAPRLQFLHGFRCSIGFQTEAYVAAARQLLRDRVGLDARVGFWDLDEFLVVDANWTTSSNSSSHGGASAGELPSYRELSRDSGRPSPIDVLFGVDADQQHGQWSIDTKVFGTSGHVTEPDGFLPANFLLAANTTGFRVQEGEPPPPADGAFSKSVCALWHLREGLARQPHPPATHSLFLGIPRTGATYRWVHDCSHRHPKFAHRISHARARLNHYYTRSEAHWRHKCLDKRADFHTAHNKSGTKCKDPEAFFDALDDVVDLRLFEQLPAAAPPAFFAHAELPPIARAKLHERCETPPTPSGAARTLCASRKGERI